MNEIALGALSAKPTNWLRLYTKFVVFAVIALIALGSLVTSHGAGLSVPDWPTSYGQNMFLFPPSMWIGGIFYEHVHRLVASGVGALTVILAIWLWRSEQRRWIKILGYVAVATVICQGVLGGLTVIFRLPAAISTGHAVLAQTFLIITVIIAYAQSFELSERSDVGQSDLIKPAIFLGACVWLQLILGAIMRHTEAGLAIPDFPTMGGSFLPTFNQEMLNYINPILSEHQLASVTVSQVVIHFLHRLGALAVACVAIWVALKAIQSSGEKVRNCGGLILLTLGIQVAFGIATVLTYKMPVVASLHVVGGAVLIVLSVLLVLRSLPPKRLSN